MRKSVAVVLAVALGLAPCAWSGVEPQELEVKSGTATLMVLSHEGKAVSKAVVVVLDKEGKVVLTATGDEEGKCVLEGLKPGTYKARISDQAILTFRVSEEGKVTMVLVVLPAPVKYAAGDAEKASNLPGLLPFVIGGVAIAGAGVAAMSSGGGGGGGDQHP